MENKEISDKLRKEILSLLEDKRFLSDSLVELRRINAKEEDIDYISDEINSISVQIDEKLDELKQYE
jgi:hypothetical protein